MPEAFHISVLGAVELGLSNVSADGACVLPGAVALVATDEADPDETRYE